MGFALAKKKAYRSIKARGLNYPNLQRNIQTRQATLVANLLDPDSTAFWSKLYRAQGHSLLGSKEFHLDMLLSSTPIRRFKKELDPFWFTNFQVWKDLQGDQLVVTDDWEPEEVAQVPIFGIPQISIQPQAGIRQRTAGRHKVHLLHHILWPQQAGAQGTGWTRRIATRGQQALNDGHIYLDPTIQGKVQGMDGPPANPSGIPLLRIKVAGGKASELTTAKGVAFYRLGADDFSPLPAHQFGRDEQIVQEKMWTALRCKEVQLKYADVWWKLLHNKLPLRSRAQHFKGNEDTTATCPLCGVYDQTTTGPTGVGRRLNASSRGWILLYP